MKHLWAVVGGAITVVTLVVAVVAWENAQRDAVEHEVVRSLKSYRIEQQAEQSQYRSEQRNVILYTQIATAEDRLKLWRAILKQHPNDITAQSNIKFWQDELNRLRRKLAN